MCARVWQTLRLFSTHRCIVNQHLSSLRVLAFAKMNCQALGLDEIARSELASLVFAMSGRALT